MASAELKVVVIALLILAVGFFYTNVRDKMTGYASAQRTVDMEEYGFKAGDSDQALPIKQTSAPLKEPSKEEFSLQTIVQDSVDRGSVKVVDPCSSDVPQQLQILLRGAC